MVKSIQNDTKQRGLPWFFGIDKKGIKSMGKQRPKSCVRTNTIRQKNIVSESPFSKPVNQVQTHLTFNRVFGLLLLSVHEFTS